MQAQGVGCVVCCILMCTCVSTWSWGVLCDIGVYGVFCFVFLGGGGGGGVREETVSVSQLQGQANVLKIGI